MSHIKKKKEEINLETNENDAMKWQPRSISLHMFMIRKNTEKVFSPH